MQGGLPILHERLLSLDAHPTEVFPINEGVISTITNYLSKDDARKTAQPYLITGESGSGKTFLLKRLYFIINEDLCDTLIPIPIEGMALFTAADIWNQCVLRLGLKTSQDDFQAILEWQATNKKRVVLLIDNMEYYFLRNDDHDQYCLRGKLNRNGAPILIASTKEVLPAFTSYNAPFYDGFKITYLKPLTISVIEAITKNGFEKHRLGRIMAYLPKTIRSVFIASLILDKSSDPSKDVEFLSDYFCSHYQILFDELSAQMQRIIGILAQSDSGLHLSEIRARIGQDNGKISPYLKLMADQRLIQREAKTSRGGVYAIVDPLFKLWVSYNYWAG